MFDRDSAGMEGVRGAKHGARIRETSFQDAGTKDDGGRGEGGTRTPPRNPLRCGEHVVEQSAERVLPLP